MKRMAAENLQQRPRMADYSPEVEDGVVTNLRNILAKFLTSLVAMISLTQTLSRSQNTGLDWIEIRGKETCGPQNFGLRELALSAPRHFVATSENSESQIYGSRDTRDASSQLSSLTVTSADVNSLFPSSLCIPVHPHGTLCSSATMSYLMVDDSSSAHQFELCV